MSMLSARSVGLAVLLALPSYLSAQVYTGTYTTRSQDGNVVTLVLAQDAQGNITGTMSGNGVRFEVEGIVDGGVAMGAVYNEQGGMYFEAHLQGGQLQLRLIETDASNEPDYSRARDVTLTKDGTAAAPAPVPVAQGNPLAGGSDPFVGSFAGQDIQLTLSQRAGSYAGTLTFQGQSYPVQATRQGNQLEGSFDAGGQPYGFQASARDAQLTLTTGGASYQLQRDAAGTNPLAVPGPQAAGSPSDQLIGTWSCQSSEGPASLQFASASELVYDGERLQYSLGQNAIRITTEYGSMEYPFQLSGGVLQVSGADGTSMRCSKAAQGAQAAVSGGGGGGGGAEQYLTGKVCSYSSSPDGGYSTSHMLYFDGQGRFAFGLETGWDVPSTVGVSINWGDGENVGTYRVDGVNKGDAVYLNFPDGRVGIARVYHVYANEITELFLEGAERHYGKSLCN